MNFLSSLDPNVSALLISVALTIGGWLYNKARGKKQDSLATTIGGVVNSAIHLALVTAASHPDDVRETVLKYLWPKLALLKIPRNATTELVVNELLEVAIADAIQDAKDQDAQMATAQATIAAAQAANAKTIADAAKQVPIITYQVATTQAEYDAMVAKNHAAPEASK